MRSIVTAVLVTAFLPGCWAAKPACTVVRAADDVCVMLEYTDPRTGEKVSERVPPAELRMAAMRTRARRLGMPIPAGSAQ